MGLMASAFCFRMSKANEQVPSGSLRAFTSVQSHPVIDHTCRRHRPVLGPCEGYVTSVGPGTADPGGSGALPSYRARAGLIGTDRSVLCRMKTLRCGSSNRQWLGLASLACRLWEGSGGGTAIWGARTGGPE